MTLRRHQADLAAVAEGIARGSGVRDIFAAVTPGGGKSALPGILADRLIGPVVDRILWVVPRNSLRDQGERDFPDWSRYRIRSAGNEYDPCRGTAGYITTYQAIASDPARHLETVSSGRWAVILDEPHHVLDGGAWHRALDPVLSRAAVRLFMSGTFSRGDGAPIAHLQYDGEGRPLFERIPHTAAVRYSRTDALREGRRAVSGEVAKRRRSARYSEAMTSTIFVLDRCSLTAWASMRAMRSGSSRRV